MTIPPTCWRKASYSSEGGNCVELRRAADAVGVRDTKYRQGGALALSPAALDAVLELARQH
jgi:hypothetical protein